MINLKKGGDNSSTSKKKKWALFLFISIAILAFIVFFFIFFIPSYNSNLNMVTFPKCGDGSFYNSCSLEKPYYCSNGSLIKNSSVCGCPNSFSKSDNSCISTYQSLPKVSNFSYVLDGTNGSINFTSYGGFVRYLLTLPDSITYTNGQQPLRSDFILMRLNEPNQESLLTPIIKQIQNLAPDSQVNQARIAISYVQNIPWGSSGRVIDFGNTLVDYSRYPYQVLYDNQGLCGEKSELLAFILRDLGYGVALFYYPSENHEALGIKCPVKYSLDGTGYCFVETSGPSIISDSSLKYAGGVTLTSTPQVIIISDGISLPDNMDEYGDAKVMDSLSNRTNLDPISGIRLNQLEQKYGLSKIYNIG